MSKSDELAEHFILAILFAIMLGSFKKMMKILGLKDHPMKIDYSISNEAFRKNCEKFAEQREESFKAIYELIAFEQRHFLKTGYVDPFLRKRFKGMELSDSVSIISTVERVKASYSLLEIDYDEEIMYDYFWTLSMLKYKGTCVVGDLNRVKAIVNLNKCRGLSINQPNLRTFELKDFWEDNLWLLSTGQNIALI